MEKSQEEWLCKTYNSIENQHEIKGPYNQRDLEVLLKTNEISQFTKVKKVNSEDWIFLKDVNFIQNFSQEQNVNDNDKINIQDIDKQLQNQLQEGKLILNKKKNQIPKKKNIKKKKKKEKWYKAKLNTSIYVQGLPQDITKKEMSEFFNKAGLIRLDPFTGEQRIKIYKDQKGQPKGDGLISYFKLESLELAFDLLQGREIRKDYPIKISKAVFEQKGEYKPRTQTQIDDLAKIKYKANKEKLFGWGDENFGEGLKIVILQNIFSLDDFDETTRQQFFEFLQNDIEQFIEREIGVIKKIQIFKENSLGIVKLKFNESSCAEKCIKTINNRLYNGRVVKCFYYDGKTNYNKIQETIEEKNERIDMFEQWLQNQIDSKNFLNPDNQIKTIKNLKKNNIQKLEKYL